MELVDLTLATPAENLALDEALLLRAEEAESAPREFLRFWESDEPFVVLGVAGKIDEEVDRAACKRDHVPVLRRASGGGTVLQGPGCLNFALVLSFAQREELAGIHASYRAILGDIAAALELPGAHLAGTSDIALEELKFSGNAQKRKRNTLLHHGTILYDFPVERIGMYLRQPSTQPDYRRDRPHATFVRNVPLSRTQIVERLSRRWKATRGSTDLAAIDLEPLVSEKYGNPEWTERF